MDHVPGILQRISSGDATALSDCIDAYGPLVWGVARRRIPDVHDAEEAVQDVLAAIWEHASRFDPERGSEKTFVMTLARRRIIDRARRKRPSDAALVVEPPEAPPEAPAVEIADELRRVNAALESLRPIEQRILRLSIHEGLSHGEVAQKIDMPLGTVKTHLRRGLQRVRELLGVGHRKGL